MDLGSAFADVCSVAIELQPEVFYLSVTECLENTAIELVASRVRRRGIGQIKSETPHACHASSKFLDSAIHWNHICISGVQGTYE
jgi:hypothetical protein